MKKDITSIILIFKLILKLYSHDTTFIINLLKLSFWSKYFHFLELPIFLLNTHKNYFTFSIL